MTSCTPHAQSEKGIVHSRGDFVEEILSTVFGNHVVRLVGPQAVEARSYDSFFAGVDFIASQLFPNKTVKRAIFVEGANHIVAESP